MNNPYLEYLESKYGNLLYQGFIGVKDMETYAQLWQDREMATKKYAWAIPNQQIIDALVKLSPIIEIGAGSGYWASLIKSSGGEIQAFDSHPWLYPYFEVKEGSEEVLKEHKVKTLFLCWPPYGEKMAYRSLKLFKGNNLVYIGEGSGGCTGDDKFHELLKSWTLVETIKIPSYPGINDKAWIYSRK